MSAPTSGDRLSREALIEAAANAISKRPCDRDYDRHLAHVCPQAKAVLDVILPLIADAIGANGRRNALDSNYREGLADGYFRAARLVRSLAAPAAPTQTETDKL